MEDLKDINTIEELQVLELFGGIRSIYAGIKKSKNITQSC